MNSTDWKLTAYAKSSGCGCKISSAVLDEILVSNRTAPQHKLLIGNATNDDAAVYDLQDGRALIVTTDFFTPIVDDAYTFGQVAAANALSDVYAMGGTPITAIAILGWPIQTLPAELAARVIEGAKEICVQAGIVISGGHTIEAPEPFFGLSVNGIAPVKHIKQNNTAKAGELIVMTKPLGAGILSAAQKRGKLNEEHLNNWIKNLTLLNTFGSILGQHEQVSAMTDITGFGLLGHLYELTKGSGHTAEIEYASIPKMNETVLYIKEGIIPDATYRNWNAYSAFVELAPTLDAMEAFALLPDPQTNGGLLFTVNENVLTELQQVASKQAVTLSVIGRMVNEKEKRLYFN